MSGHKRKSQRGTSLGCPARTWFKANLGIVTMALKAIGDSKGARDLLQRALAIIRRTYGDDHHLTRTTLANLDGLGDD